MIESLDGVEDEELERGADWPIKGKEETAFTPAMPPFQADAVAAGKLYVVVATGMDDEKFPLPFRGGTPEFSDGE